MASLNECIDALAATIRTYSTARVYDYVPTPPIANSVILSAVSSENLTFDRGFIMYAVDLLVLAGSMSEKGAQRWLNDQITGNGSESILGAIHEHPTLGTVDGEPTGHTATATTMTASARGFRDHGLVPMGPPERVSLHWSAVIPVQIVTRGNA